MSTQQGISEADAHKGLFGGPGRKSDMEALVAYVTSESRGAKMNVSLDDPRVKEMYDLGEKMFFFRGGTHDFACATCHGDDGKRIRLQDLPNLTSKEGAQKAYTTWPAYRVSQGELRTFQWRLNDCFRQQRFPQLVYGSDASIALTTVPCPQCQRRSVRRAGHQALREAAMQVRTLLLWRRHGRRRGRLRDDVLRLADEREGRGGIEGVVQGITARRSSIASTRTRRSGCAAPTPARRCRRTSRRASRAQNLATIKWPGRRQVVGDWKDGEKIAQEGRGKQYSDDPKGPVGGNCYACHQLSPQEVSYGTIGPSLLRVRQDAAATPKRPASTPMPRCTTRTRTRRAATCRGSATTGSSPRRRSRMSSRCSWTRIRRSTSDGARLRLGARAGPSPRAGHGVTAGRAATARA